MDISVTLEGVVAKLRMAGRFDFSLHRAFKEAYDPMLSKGGIQSPEIDLGKERAGELFLVLSELFNNALGHGLLKLDSALKHHALGMEAYFDERERRLHSTYTGHMKLHLEKVMYEEGGIQIRIRVHDSGNGFDHQKVRMLIASDTQPHGRGIGLVCGLCSTVEYLGNDPEVLACFDLPAGA